jgi:hypothetical protein
VPTAAWCAGRSSTTCATEWCQHATGESGGCWPSIAVVAEWCQHATGEGGECWPALVYRMQLQLSASLLQTGGGLHRVHRGVLASGREDNAVGAEERQHAACEGWPSWSAVLLPAGQ